MPEIEQDAPTGHFEWGGIIQYLDAGEDGVTEVLALRVSGHYYHLVRLEEDDRVDTKAIPDGLPMVGATGVVDHETGELAGSIGVVYATPDGSEWAWLELQAELEEGADA